MHLNFSSNLKRCREERYSKRGVENRRVKAYEKSFFQTATDGCLLCTKHINVHLVYSECYES